MTKNRAKNHPIKVAIIGHRGIPNSYGGFETLAEELAVNLVGLGATVTAYCRSNYFQDKPTKYRGVNLVYLSTITKKSLDTLFHTFISVCHSFIFNTATILIIVNVGNAPFGVLAKMLGKKVIFCVDGLDWQRKKWGRFARLYLKGCSFLAGIASNVIVTDASSVYEFYKKERRLESVFIPYGTEIETSKNEDYDALKKYGLEYKKYFIYVARFEPENNPMLVIKAHAESGSKYPLVMVGDNRYNPEFVEKLKLTAGKNVIFTGFIFGHQYKQLVRNSLCYVRAAEVGGHSPALIEAMGRGVCVIANDKKENREPLGDTGLYFSMDVPSLARQFEYAGNHPEEVIEKGLKSAQRAMIMYSWDRIAYDYFKLVKSLAGEKFRQWNNVDIKNNEENKKILITGAGGALGYEVQKHLSKIYQVISTTLHPVERNHLKMDITSYEESEKIISQIKPDYILHLAAVTDLEYCERNLSKSYTINTLGTKNISQLCAKYGATMIFTSTANVFNGVKTYYRESDEPLPINVYGLTKHMGEMMVKYYSPNFLIIRLGWLIGGGPRHEKKFVGRIVQQILSGTKKILAVSDKIGTISYAPHVAKTISNLIENKRTGIYHVVSKGTASRYDIAKNVIDILGYSGDVLVEQVNSDYFNVSFSAPRPARECLISDKLYNINEVSNYPWQISLRDYLVNNYSHAIKADYQEVEYIADPVAI